MLLQSLLKSPPCWVNVGGFVDDPTAGIIKVLKGLKCHCEFVFAVLVGEKGLVLIFGLVKFSCPPEVALTLSSR